MKSKFLFVCSLSCLLFGQAWQTARPGYRYAFPRDHFSHPDYQTEWWYYTGNVRSTGGHRYGFELTFFRQAQRLTPQAARGESAVWLPDQLYLAHFALSDIDRQAFHHAERLNRAGPGIAGVQDGRYWNGNWQVRWSGSPDAPQELTAVDEYITLHLRLQADKPFVIHGQDGISRKGPASRQASHYISFTRLSASGELQIAGAREQLSGLAWMDHEFFTEPSASNLSGWDWFAIQLNNGEELMLYRLRNKASQLDPYSSGTYIDKRGQSHYLSAAQFKLTPGDPWRSQHSGASYPLSWEIEVPSLGVQLKQTAALRDQELWSEDALTPSYWEGAVNYRGTMRGDPVEGVGYLEMTGYNKSIQLSGLAGH